MKKYIIFGAGLYGEEALLYYGLKNVAYFCDNKKCGKIIRGIEVISFERLIDIHKDYDIILAVSRALYKDEMQRQLEENDITYQIFEGMETKLAENNFSGEYEFIDRSRSEEKLLIILAGYKEYLWDSIFARVRRYAPKDMDICVMTAGYGNERLKKICEEEGWSYLYTYENKLSLTQNMTIQVHPAAKWIYKMDEDIFITKDLFTELMDTFLLTEKEAKYEIGITAPLMAVNSYGYRRILEYEDKLDDYINRFGAAVSGRGKIFSDPEAAEYLWDLTLPIDVFANKMKKNETRYSICHHRFSIGCFLIRRERWEEMGGFKTAPEGVLGVDEEYLCKWCMNASKAIVVAERAYAGHFAYGPQTEEMKRFYERRKEEFAI